MAQTVILHGSGQRKFAHDLIEKAPAGAVLTIREASRSVDQNSKLWAMLSDVSRSMPDGRRHTAEVWKTLFMHACGHAVQFETGLNGNPFRPASDHPDTPNPRWPTSSPSFCNGAMKRASSGLIQKI